MSEQRVVRIGLDEETPAPVGTYQTFVRPHQLRRGDVYVSSGTNKLSRSVVVEKIEHGSVPYRGSYVPVVFVYGHEGYSTKVVFTKTEWEYLEVTRLGDAPTFYRPALTRAARADVY